MIEETALSHQDVHNVIEKSIASKVESFFLVFTFIKAQLPLVLFLIAGFIAVVASFSSYEAITASCFFFLMLWSLHHALFLEKQPNRLYLFLFTLLNVLTILFLPLPLLAQISGIAAFGFSVVLQAFQYEKFQYEKIDSFHEVKTDESEINKAQLIEKSKLEVELRILCEEKEKIFQELQILQEATKSLSDELEKTHTKIETYFNQSISSPPISPPQRIPVTSEKVVFELEKQQLHSQAKYDQLKEQFQDQKIVLDDTRKELFILQGREMALSNKLREYENSSLYGSLHEMVSAFSRTSHDEFESVQESYEELIQSLLEENESLRK